MRTHVLETDRLVVRRWQPDDAEAFRESSPPKLEFHGVGERMRAGLLHQQLVPDAADRSQP